MKDWRDRRQKHHRCGKLDDITVVQGTAFEDLDLPEKVSVTYGKNETAEVDVTWEKGTYNAQECKTYVLEGALTLPEGIANPDGLKAIVKVTVEEKETPVKKYTVSVNVKDSEKAMGTVSMDKEDGVYEDGMNATVTATANEGYEFVNWTSEGKVFSDSAAYEFAVEKDMELTANFKAKEEPKPPVTEDTFKLNVTVNDDKMGTVKLDPAKESYKAGDVVTATATAKDGYKFVNWTVDGKEVSDKAEYAFKVDRDVTLKANFEKVAADPKLETPKPEDPKDEDKAVQTGDNGVSPIIPLAG